jgi:hypothetical protein
VAPLSDEVIGALQRFRNVILEGPPGTGKTFVVERLAALWSSATGRPLLGDGSGAYAITLHPSTSYEDFVEGLRYESGTGSFHLRNGFMTRTVIEAEENPDADYLLLLDELNRANVPKVLGDLLLTLEPSKRMRWDGSAWVGGVAVTLPYSGRLFSVPDNIYVLGTMNTSDRSIAPLDAALRRRFAFVRVRPLRAAALVSELTASRGASIASLAATSIEKLDELNSSVLRPVLGPDGELGHSYLFDLSPSPITDPQLRNVLQKAISTAHKVFWTEVRVANGGSGNQFDLVETGAGGGKGSLELFYPLLTASGVMANPPPHSGRHSFSLVFGGKSYADNVLRWNSGNSNYRIYLQGETTSGEKLSAVANTSDPVPHESSARTLEHRVHIWLERSDGSLELQRVPNTQERRTALGAVSSWSHKSKGAQSREFGLLDMAKLKQAMTSGDEPRMTWRYAILPQLVELAVTNGVEDLFDPTRRQAWQTAHGSPADTDALRSFDGFLASMSIWLRVVGHDLGRTLMILDVAPTTSGAAGLSRSGSTQPPAAAPLASALPIADEDKNGSGSDAENATVEVAIDEDPEPT